MTSAVRGGVLAVVLVAGAASAARAQVETPAPPVLQALEGRWNGQGTLFGRPAAFSMCWEAGDAGFVRLAFTNAFVAEDGARTPLIAARAVYFLRGSWGVGAWVDDRPEQLTIEAVATDSSLVATWASPSERGRTEYLVRSPGQVTVRDFVLAAAGERQFAEASYSRVPASGADAGAGCGTH